LQCVAVCCSVLQCVAVCCSVLQCVAVCCSVLQCVVIWIASRTARAIRDMIHVNPHCNTLQRTATHCNTLQQPPIMCSNTLQQTPVMRKYLFDHLKTAPVRDITWPLSSARAVRDMIHVNTCACVCVHAHDVRVCIVHV